MNRVDSTNSTPIRVQSGRTRRYLLVLKETYHGFFKHHVFRLAASMSFFTVLSAAPIVVLMLLIAGTWLDSETVGRQLVAELENIAGKEAAEVAATIVEHVNKPKPGWITSILGIATLIFGATGMFTQLQDSLNIIWEVESAPGRSLWLFLRNRLTSLVMIITVGSILLFSPLLTAAATVLNTRLIGKVPQVAQVWEIVHLLVSILFITLILATIFKMLPYVKIKWSDVWLGAAATAVMFTIGQFLIGVYLGYSGLGLSYGAAGSLVVLLVWIYYSSLIIFGGAEFTQVFAKHFGSHARLGIPRPTLAVQASGGPIHNKP